MSEKKLHRSATEKKISGVCGGLAEYFDMDPTVVRIIWVLLTFLTASFPGLLIYIICALVMPVE